MATIKAFTDLSQSEVLSKVLPNESADMWYEDSGLMIPRLGHMPKEHTDTEVPCWSLAALMHLLPSEFTEKGKYSETTYKIDIRKYKLTNDVDIHQIAYGSYKYHEDGGYTWSDMINTGEKEDLIDAVYQMICWLKENNKI